MNITAKAKVAADAQELIQKFNKRYSNNEISDKTLKKSTIILFVKSYFTFINLQKLILRNESINKIVKK